MKNTFYLRRNEYDANLNWHALLHYVHGYELNIIEITELGQNVEQICKAFYNIEKRRNNFSLYTILKIPRILEKHFVILRICICKVLQYRDKFLLSWRKYCMK